MVSYDEFYEKMRKAGMFGTCLWSEKTRHDPCNKIEVPWNISYLCGLDCERCGVPVIIGPKGNPRNYLYPPPSIYGDGSPKEMQFLCHDCFLDSWLNDQATKCSICGKPVKDVKFFGKGGPLCGDCFDAVARGIPYTLLIGDDG